jgi:hypothetical protein
VVAAYKNLRYVERDFRHIKSGDLDLRPVFPARRTRPGAHADLHARLLPHLAPAPRLGAADLHRREPAPAGKPRRPGPPLDPRPGQGLDPAGRRYRSFRGLLEHLATLTRNQVRFAGAQATVPMLAEPTSTQREAFDLISVPIPAHPEVARTTPASPAKHRGQARKCLPNRP